MHKHSQQPYRAGRSKTGYASTSSLNSPSAIDPAGSGSRTAMSRSYMSSEFRAGTASSARHPSSAFTARSMTTPNLASSANNITMPTPVAIAAPATAKTMPNLVSAKLHKRGGSGSGPAGNQPITTTLSSSYSAAEPFPDIVPPIQSTSTHKVKPYLRKLSSAREDQGRIDLSKPLAENDKLAGLSITDYNSRPSIDSVFVPGRSHGRTTSISSQMSNSSASHKAQPFVHPMRQAPRPFTPTVVQQTFLSQDDEDDFAVEDEYRPGAAFRSRRSMSNSSTRPTPLSQTTTAADLGAIPRLTSNSQTNLSIVSSKSSMPTGSRRNTGRSQELGISPSSRTSFDRPFGHRRSDTEAQSRDERIAAARRKFQEKEADKDRKAEKEAAKKREAEEVKEARRRDKARSRSDASDRPRLQRPVLGLRTGSSLGLHSPLTYDNAQATPMPEKQPTVAQTASKSQQAGFFARLFNCGGARKK